jgi:ankyrin repeat protein
MRYFLRTGADPNYRGSQYHTTILHDALAVGREKTAVMVKLLLEKGADVNALDHSTTGDSPLYFALAMSLPRGVCDLLRDAGGESRSVDNPHNMLLLAGLDLGV